MPSTDPSVFDEPQFNGSFQHETPNDQAMSGDPIRPDPQHSVFDEITYNAQLAGNPIQDVSYRAWLEERWRGTRSLDCLLASIGLVLLAGPLAVIGVFIGTSMSEMGRISDVLNLVAVGPCVEEILKIALLLWVAEKHPYLLRNVWQVLFIAACCGLSFACIENLIYLLIYVPNPSPGLVYWRWTVCTALHVGCSFLAGIGVARVWRDGLERHAYPSLPLLTPFLLAAIVIHGAYNFAMVCLALARYEF